MSNLKQRTLDFLEIEWATYIERFNHWPAEDGRKRVNSQGYEQFRDMLAHILAWWEEGMGIILAIAEEREFERKKYDFDVFNAEAVAKYKDWDEAEFLAYFEKTRQKVVADLRSMNEAAWKNRRVRNKFLFLFIVQMIEVFDVCRPPILERIQKQETTQRNQMLTRMFDKNTVDPIAHTSIFPRCFIHRP